MKEQVKTALRAAGGARQGNERRGHGNEGVRRHHGVEGCAVQVKAAVNQVGNNARTGDLHQRQQAGLYIQRGGTAHQSRTVVERIQLIADFAVQAFRVTAPLHAQQNHHEKTQQLLRQAGIEHHDQYHADNCHVDD